MGQGLFQQGQSLKSIADFALEPSKSAVLTVVWDMSLLVGTLL